MSDHTNHTQVEEFWNWFQSIASSLAANVEDPSLLEEFDARVRQLDSTLSWEVGPGSYEPWQFVISPNLDRNLREKAREIIAHAPVAQGWEFHAARRPKNWDYKLVMRRSEGTPIELDASGWGFVLLQYPDETREVLLQGSDLPALDDDERWELAAMTLESILGEDLIMDRIDEFALVDRLEPRLADKRKPIQRLREAVIA